MHQRSLLFFDCVTNKILSSLPSQTPNVKLRFKLANHYKKYHPEIVKQENKFY